MKVFVLVRNIHNDEEDTNYTVDLFNSYDEAYEVMNQEYKKELIPEKDYKDEVYTYHIYSNCAFVAHKYYNIEWEIQEKEINF